MVVSNPVTQNQGDVLFRVEVKRYPGLIAVVVVIVSGSWEQPTANGMAMKTMFNNCV